MPASSGRSFFSTAIRRSTGAPPWGRRGRQRNRCRWPTPARRWKTGTYVMPMQCVYHRLGLHCAGRGRIRPRQGAASNPLRENPLHGNATGPPCGRVRVFRPALRRVVGAGAGGHQPGLRRRRQQRRHAEERLHRAAQQRTHRGRPDRLERAVRLLHGYHLEWPHQPQRQHPGRRFLPDPAGAGRRRHGGPAHARRHRHHRHGRHGRQGRAEPQHDGADRCLPDRRCECGRLRRFRQRGQLLRRQRADRHAEQHHRRAAWRRRQHRHQQQRRRLRGRCTEPAQQRRRAAGTARSAAGADHRPDPGQRPAVAAQRQARGDRGHRHCDQVQQRLLPAGRQRRRRPGHVRCRVRVHQQRTARHRRGRQPRARDRHGRGIHPVVQSASTGDHRDRHADGGGAGNRPRPARRDRTDRRRTQPRRPARHAGAAGRHARERGAVGGDRPVRRQHRRERRAVLQRRRVPRRPARRGASVPRSRHRRDGCHHPAGRQESAALRHQPGTPDGAQPRPGRRTAAVGRHRGGGRGPAGRAGLLRRHLGAAARRGHAADRQRWPPAGSRQRPPLRRSHRRQLQPAAPVRRGQRQQRRGDADAGSAGQAPGQGGTGDLRLPEDPGHPGRGGSGEPARAAVAVRTHRRHLRRAPGLCALPAAGQRRGRHQRRLPGQLAPDRRRCGPRRGAGRGAVRQGDHPCQPERHHQPAQRPSAAAPARPRAPGRDLELSADGDRQPPAFAQRHQRHPARQQRLGHRRRARAGEARCAGRLPGAAGRGDAAGEPGREDRAGRRLQCVRVQRRLRGRDGHHPGRRRAGGPGADLDAQPADRAAGGWVAADRRSGAALLVFVRGQCADAGPRAGQRVAGDGRRAARGPCAHQRGLRRGQLR